MSCETAHLFLAECDFGFHTGCRHFVSNHVLEVNRTRLLSFFVSCQLVIEAGGTPALPGRKDHGEAWHVREREPCHARPGPRARGPSGGLVKRRCGSRQPNGRREPEKAAGLVPPKRVSPLPCSMLEGGCPEEGCRGETRRGEPVLPGPRAALFCEQARAPETRDCASRAKNARTTGLE